MSDIILPQEAESAMTAEVQAEIRAKIRAIIDRREMTGKQIAREADIPYGTFSSWLGNTYQGRTERVAAEVRRWMEKTEEHVRARGMVPNAPEFCMTKSAQDYFAVFEHAQHMPDMVIIAGSPGTGKTSAAMAYRKRNPNVHVVACEPVFTSPRVLLEGIAGQLGMSDRYGSGHRISMQIVARLRETRGLLILDEAQHLSTPSLDQLRTIHDKAEIGVAMVGNELVYSRFEGAQRTPQFAQLFSRVGMRLQRPMPVKRDVDMLLDGWGIEEEALRKLLHAIARKPGALRGMTKTLRIAHMLAHAEQAPVGEQHVMDAWAQLGNPSLDRG